VATFGRCDARFASTPAPVSFGSPSCAHVPRVPSPPHHQQQPVAPVYPVVLAALVALEWRGVSAVPAFLELPSASAVSGVLELPCVLAAPGALGWPRALAAPGALEWLHASPSVSPCFHAALKPLKVAAGNGVREFPASVVAPCQRR